MRKTSTVAGKRGKTQLNPVVMDFVKSTCFNFYPAATPLKKEEEWKNAYRQ